MRRPTKFCIVIGFLLGVQIIVLAFFHSLLSPKPLLTRESDLDGDAAICSAPAAISKPLLAHPFDMLLLMLVPTCINHLSAKSALKFLQPQGLRKVWIVTAAEWVDSVNQWDPDIHAVSESHAVPGVSREGIRRLLEKYAWNDALGRTGWYLQQFIKLGFVQRSDVLDVLLVHDADQVVLPSFQVFGHSHFFAPNGSKIPKFRVKVGGLEVGSYDHAYKCLTDSPLIRPPVDIGRRHSFVTHSFVVFRPFADELLDSFGFRKVRALREHLRKDLDTSNSAVWVENIIQCLNPEEPSMGFSEMASYTSAAMANHRDALEIEQDRCWKRNMLGVLPKEGFCCPTRESYTSSAELGLQYAGLELAHSQHESCGYNGDKGPYPPADHSFWAEWNVSFSSAARHAFWRPRGEESIAMNFRAYMQPIPRVGIWDVVAGNLSIWTTKVHYDTDLKDTVQLLRDISQRTSHVAESEIVVHTEINPDAGEDICFKNVLPVVSVLATQPEATVYVWFREPWWVPELLECFSDLQRSPVHGKRLIVKLFEPDKELEKVGDLAGFNKSLYAATSIGKGQKGEKANYSNLRRYLALYIYGGFWIDSDVVLLRPLWPLAGMNLVYGCPERFEIHPLLPWPKYQSVHINGAYLSVDSPRSKFMFLCMLRIMELLEEQASGRLGAEGGRYFKWGGNVFWHILQSSREADQPLPFVALPCDWFDNGWRHKSWFPGTTVPWAETYTGEASQADVLAALQSGAFANHFHGGGKWTAKVNPKSIASLFMKHFTDALGVQVRF